MQPEFDFEERSMGRLSGEMFGTSAIHARRCRTCQLIYFVNDINGEWLDCRNCRKAEKMEVTETKIKDKDIPYYD